MSFDWGSVPDWVAGVGSMLAVGAFLVAVLREVRIRRMDEQRAEADRAQQAEHDRRFQAERITYYLELERSAYPEQQTQPAGQRWPIDAAEFYGVAGLDIGAMVLVNNSESCVYSMIASVPHALPEMPLRGIGVCPPGATRVIMPMREYPGEGSGTWRRVADFASNRLVPWVQFHDQAGVAWRRYADGTLSEESTPVGFPDYSP